MNNNLNWILHLFGVISKEDYINNLKDEIGTLEIVEYCPCGSIRKVKKKKIKTDSLFKYLNKIKDL